jgi:hypothetical protein
MQTVIQLDGAEVILERDQDSFGRRRLPGQTLASIEQILIHIPQLNNHFDILLVDQVRPGLS